MTRAKFHPRFIANLPLVTLSLIGVLMLAIYLPMADGPLILDDKPNIVHNPGLKISDLSLESFYQSATSMRQTFSERAELLQRPVSYISFSLDWYFSGGDFQTLKITNILLHLIGGILLYLFCRQLLALPSTCEPRNNAGPAWQKWGAVVIAGFWLLHPLMVSTVLYSVQRMTILSALFSFCALNLFLYYRRQFLRTGDGLAKGVLGISLFTALAFLSKENGLLVLLLCGLIEICFYRGKVHQSVSSFAKRVYQSLLIAPAVFVLGYLCWTYFQSSEALLESRLFDTDMRLMTQLRVLFSYLLWLILPLSDFLTFHHDNVTISHSLIDPVAGLIALLAWGIIFTLMVYWWRQKKATYLVFGLGWFIVAHLLESTVLNLELVFEHRNYFAYVGPMVALVWLCFKTVNRLQTSPQVAGLIIVIFLIILPALLSYGRAKHWQSEETLIVHWYEVNPTSPRTWSAMSEYYHNNNRPVDALNALEKGIELAPWEAGFGFAQLGILCQSGINLPTEQLQQIIERTKTAINQRPFTAYSSGQLGTLTTLCRNMSRLKSYQPVFQSLSQHRQPKAAAMAFYLLALIELSEGKHRVASDYLQQVIKRDPNAKEAQSLLLKISDKLE